MQEFMDEPEEQVHTMTANNHDSHSHDQHHGHTQGFNMIAPPVQRQKWGDTQVLPHVNWGDLFFDLFYVSAAYNLSAILKYNLNAESILYFAACFQPLFHAFWMDKLLFDARFSTDDIFHRILEVIKLCLLATAVLRIRPDMNLAKNRDMFLFCLSCLVSIFLSALVYVEIAYIWVNGQQMQSKSAAKTQLIIYIPYFLIYGAATIYSAILHFGSDGSGYDDGNKNYIPAIIMASTWIVTPMNNYVNMVLRGSGDFKLRSVPMNIEYNIHRFGEWIMLMLGESILSLLIVDVVDGDIRYNITFYAGILSVILLQYFHYKNQPHDPNEHATRKSRERGITFVSLLVIYSAALIVVGVSYKMFLTEYVKEASYATKYDTYDKERSLMAYNEDMRFLAGEGGAVSDSYTKEDRRQRIAHLFVGGLTVAFLSLDLQILAHKGIHESYERCTKVGKMRTKILLVEVFPRICKLLVTACASQFVTDPMQLSLFGLAIIVFSIIFMFVGECVITNKEDKCEADHDHWPNVTEPESIENNTLK